MPMICQPCLGAGGAGLIENKMLELVDLKYKITS
jgi:hypothetical protein